jgi:NADPH:quinone reductase-like Zn-dependent oxidoreductase
MGAGTGGVSMFALLISLAAGIKPIITSSSDAKLEKLKHLGDIGVINYRTNPDIAAEVLRKTDVKGVGYVINNVGFVINNVGFVINNVGLSSIPTDLQMLRKGGSIALVGFLEGFEADFSPSILMALIAKEAKLQ